MNEIDIERQKLLNCFRLVEEMVSKYARLFPNNLNEEMKQEMLIRYKRMYKHEQELLEASPNEYLQAYRHDPAPVNANIGKEDRKGLHISDGYVPKNVFYDAVRKSKRRNNSGNPLPKYFPDNLPTQNDIQTLRKKQLSELMRNLNQYLLSLNIYDSLYEPVWPPFADLLEFKKTVQLEFKISEKRLVQLGEDIPGKVEKNIRELWAIRTCNWDPNFKPNPEQAARLKIREKKLLLYFKRNTIGSLFVNDILFEYAPGQILFLQTGIQELDAKLREQLHL